MDDTISISQFIKAIKRLPEDEPSYDPKRWYRTQKEHWLGWLAEYHGPGAYGRIPGKNRDARFAYNHVVCPDLLLYLIHAIPLSDEIILVAEEAAQSGTTLMHKVGAIRKVVPWEIVEEALFPNPQNPIVERIKRHLRPLISR